MSRRASTVVVDRLVLDGLDLAPERAESVRAQLEIELFRLLNGQELATVDTPRVQAPTLSNQAIRSDRGLVSNLAHSILAACTASSGQNQER